MHSGSCCFSFSVFLPFLSSILYSSFPAFFLISIAIPLTPSLSPPFIFHVLVRHNYYYRVPLIVSVISKGAVYSISPYGVNKLILFSLSFSSFLSYFYRFFFATQLSFLYLHLFLFQRLHHCQGLIFNFKQWTSPLFIIISIKIKFSSHPLIFVRRWSWTKSSWYTFQPINSSQTCWWRRSRFGSLTN